MIFPVSNSDLARLGDVQAVKLFGDLLWAEASRHGIARSKITISLRTTVPDGGVDAEVRDAPDNMTSDLIKEGQTAYQIKTGESFKPWQEGAIRKELFGRKAASRENLGEAVRECLENQGTYVLVCFGQDPTAEERTKAKAILAETLAGCDYPSAKVEVWGQGNIRSFLNSFPSIRLALIEGVAGFFQTHTSWTRNKEMDRELVDNDDYRNCISGLRTALAKLQRAIHLRITGEAGIGKTRFVLESLRAPELAPRVLYTRSSSAVLDSQLLTNLCLDDNHESLILVVDECSIEHARMLWDRLYGRGARIQLITIHNEENRELTDTQYPRLPHLTQTEIKQILLSYDADTLDVDRWVQLAGDSPRFAHLIGGNLKLHPDDVLKSVDNIYDRIIAGYDNPKSDRTADKRSLLAHFALFTHVGHEGPVASEAGVVLKLLQKVRPSFDIVRFEEVISELQSMRLLQGHHTLYITPKAVHVWFWCYWWDNYSQHFDLKTMLDDMPESMRRGFLGMFRYADQSAAACHVVKELLGPSGPFRDGSALRTDFGSELFFSLTEADPALALAILRRTLGAWTKEELLQFQAGRRKIVHALERIVIWRDHFRDAARFLLALADAENETWANNASGIFASIFTTAMGPVGWTEAPPNERFPVLDEAVLSPSKERRLLGLKACAKSLTEAQTMRTVGAEHQGLRPGPEFWQPQSWDELIEAHRQVWQLVADGMDGVSTDERSERLHVLLDSIRFLSRYEALSDLIIQTLRNLALKPFIENRDLIRAVVDLLHYEGKRLGDPTREKWEVLRRELEGTGFSARLRRHVGMDLLVDKFDEAGDPSDAWQDTITELAKEGIQEQELLKNELAWLVTAEAANGLVFGYDLAKCDPDWSLLPTILSFLRSAKDNADVFFLSGYLRRIFETDQDEWEQQLDTLAEDNDLRKTVPEITRRCGLSDRAARRVLKVAKESGSGIEAIRHFSLGNFIAVISKEAFLELIDFLIESDEGVVLAIELFRSYYSEGDRLPPNELTLTLLVNDVWYSNDRSKVGLMSLHAWHETARYYLKSYPDESPALAKRIVEILSKRQFELSTEAEEVLVAIAKTRPIELWGLLASAIERADAVGQYRLQNMLQGSPHVGRGGDGILRYLPADKIWNWVDEDVEERAVFLGRCVAADLAPGSTNACTAREILVRYGERQAVRSAISANFLTETWWGPMSDHYQQKVRLLEGLLEREANENVRMWIADYLGGLRQSIEDAKIREEREP